MAEKLTVAALIVIAVSAAALAVVAVMRYCGENVRRAKVEGKIMPDTKRLIWRIVNTGIRNISIVEVGVRCGDKYASYRPLYSATEDINNIPHILGRGEVASYRKEAERFMFRPADEEELKKTNPYIYFYAKDSEGAEYSEKSEYKFVQYLTMLIGGGK